MIPVVPQSELGVAPIDWLGLPRHYQNDGEMEVLAAIARRARARSMIEVGCNTGRTAALMLRNVPTLERYWGVDVPPDHVPTLPSQRTEVPTMAGHFALKDPRFELVVRPGGSFDLGPGDVGPADVCYIDGDHSEAAVRNDTALAIRWTRLGGAIVWHDYFGEASSGIRAVVDEMHAIGYAVKLIERTWFAYLITG